MTPGGGGPDGPIVSYELVAFNGSDPVEIRAPLLRASSAKLVVIESLARWIARNRGAQRIEVREIVVEHTGGGYERPRRSAIAHMRESATVWYIMTAPNGNRRPWDIEAKSPPILKAP